MITIPKLTDLIDDVRSDLEGQYGTSISVFGKVFLNAVAVVQASKLKLFYLAIGFLQKNIFVDTADQEAAGGTLERFGRIKLNRNPYPATAGQYDCEITGSVGAVIPASTTFKSNDDSQNPGKLFILDAEFTLTSSPDTINLRALEAGVDSQLQVDDELTATAPIAGVDKAATVTGETVAPLDEEDIEDYRQKAIDAYRLEAQGGSAADYRLWAEDVQGVKTAYAYPSAGNDAEVDVYVEATIADSTDGKGTPSAAMLDDVDDVFELDPDTTKPLDERGRRPLGVFQINTQAVTVKDIVIEINNFVGITASMQTSIFNALQAEIDKIRPFVAGADIVDEKNNILDLNKIIGVIYTLFPGSVFDSVSLSVAGTLLNTFTFENGDIPFLTTVNYI